MEWTDDPVADAERYQEELEKERKTKLAKLPICECCGEPIEQEKAVYYNDQYCCEDCEREFWDAIRYDFLERT